MEKISEGILTFLLNASWQIAAVTGVAALAAYFMQRVPAIYRHPLWVAALLAAVLLPLISVSTPAPSVSLPDMTPALTTEELVTAASPSSSQPSARTIRPVSFSMQVGTVIACLYAAVVLLGLFRFTRAITRTMRIRAEARIAETSPELRRIWAACLDAFRLQQVDLLVSASVPGPVALGALRRAVILPDRFQMGQADEVLTAAIGHELCAHRSPRLCR